MKRSILLNTCALAGAAIIAATGPSWSADTKLNASTVTAKPTQIEANKLIGTSVYNMGGEKIGDINSVLLDQSGAAIGAVIGVGGFLGLGERDVAVGWQDLQITDNGRTVRLDATKDQLKMAPEYKFSSNDRKQTAFVDPRYRNSAVGSGNTAATRSDNRYGSNDARNWAAIGPAGEIRTSRLEGVDVRNAAGDKIGDIDEVVIGANGRPQLILSVGGFLGIGEHRVAVDWNRVRLSRDSGGALQAQLNMTRDQLKALPEYRFDNTTARR
jgi:sporulation protein YlmC with PRC-barrel domain